MTVEMVKPISEKIIFRPGTIEDAERMWEIDQACFDPGISYPIEIFYYHLLINRDPSFVAIDEDRIIGFILTSKAARSTSLLVTIDIMEGWRRQRLGAKLMELAEKAQKKRGCRIVTLQVDVGNKGAIGFYDKMGYTKKKQLRNYYGPGRDAFLYSKEI